MQALRQTTAAVRRRLVWKNSSCSRSGGQRKADAPAEKSERLEFLQVARSHGHCDEVHGRSLEESNADGGGMGSQRAGGAPRLILRLLGWSPGAHE